MRRKTRCEGREAGPGPTNGATARPLPAPCRWAGHPFLYDDNSKRNGLPAPGKMLPGAPGDKQLCRSAAPDLLGGGVMARHRETVARLPVAVQLSSFQPCLGSD